MRLSPWFLFVCFSIVYFSCRGILVSQFGMDSLDTILVSLLRITCFIYFILKLPTKENILIKNFKNILTILVVITLLSFSVNSVSIEQLLLFNLSVFYPIGFFLIIVDNFSFKETKGLLILLFIIIVIPFGFSVLTNLGGFKSGLIIDDYFYGFFGFPRAYHFSVFVVLTAILLLLSISLFDYFSPKIKIIIYLLLLTPVLAGAGRMVFVMLISIGLYLLTKIRGSFLKKIFFAFLAIGLMFVFQFYASYYTTTEDVYNNFLENPMSNLKLFYFVESFRPFINYPITLIFGNGPAGYMSSSAMPFNPYLVDKFNTEIHNTSNTDIYQGFNNIIGFVGDVGIFFLFLYYYLVYIIYRNLKEKLGNNIYISLVFIFVILYSFFFHVFDDPYYSLTIWLFFGVSLKMAQMKSSLIKKKTFWKLK
jgi:hypothetical protein